jgi:uncharacterized membrane protein
VKSRIATGYDLLAILGLSFVYVLSLLVSPGSVFHALLGLPFALMLPGYTVQAAVYPRQDELELPLRWALGCVLSLTLVTLLAMSLNALGRLDVVWLVCSLELITVVCCGIAYWRRSRLVPDSQSLLSRLVWKSRQQLVWVLFASTLVIVGLVLATGIFVDLLGGRQSQTYTTAFYLLGEDGRAGNYPGEVRLGHPFSATLGIINHEQEAATYRIEMQIGDQGPETLAQVSLQPSETWERTFDVIIKQSDNTTVLVRFNLYTEFGSSPYRSLHQRVQIVDLVK